MKRFSTLLLLGGLLSVIPATAAWDGLEGTGTQENPYQISSASDFQILASQISSSNTGAGEYFVLTQDINFNGSASNPVQLPGIGKAGITNVANVSWGFDGNLDGNNHTISGIYHTVNTNSNEGQFNALFSSLGEQGVIKNVIFGADNYVSSYNYVSSIASLSHGVIENCINYADLTAANAFAAGICGYIVKGSGEITGCKNYGNISAMTYATGIVGGTQSGSAISTSSSDYSGYVVSGCENFGDMYTTNCVGAAGIAGSYSGIIKDCVNNGAISGDLSKTTGQYNAGIVAALSYVVEVSGCINNGAVSGVKNVAGIVGNVMAADGAEFNLTGCQNYGTVTGTGDYISGIIANSARAADIVSVSDCYNAGEVSTSLADAANIGNIIGNSVISVGEGNTIEKGLPTYAYDINDNIEEIVTPSNAWMLAEGEGTEDNPYVISSPEDFLKLAQNISEDNTGEGEYFVITEDINFGGTAADPVQLPAIGKAGITSIANIAWGFEGNLDGGEHTISGIYHTENSNDDAGKYNALFASVGVNGVISNIIFGQDNYVSSYNYVGSIASISKGTITNCTNEADLVASNAFAGGIVAYLASGTGVVEDNTNKGDISAMTYAAGIVAGSQSGAAITSYDGYVVSGNINSGTISTTNGTGAAGIAGSYSGILTNNTNNGTIDDTASSTGQYTAGIASSLSYPVEVTGNINNGEVKGTKNIGGIVGMVMKGDDSEITISANTNNGDVTATGANVAGIVGNTLRRQDVVTIAECTNTGVITTTDEGEDIIGNLRGSILIALGEDNVIAEGLTHYSLDPESEEDDKTTNITGINSNETLQDGKYIIDGNLIIIRNGEIYNTQGQKIR